MSTGIFISYRRLGGLETARNLRDRLVSLHYNVFFDLTSMREGKFNQQIFEEISKADDFILILSEGALDRCPDEQDWLRMEIQKALSLHKNIIPIWTPAFSGYPSSLPRDIADIKHYDSVKLSEDYYDAFFLKVLARLKAQRRENVKPSYIIVPGQDSRFITVDEWLNKNVRFTIMRYFRWLLFIAALMMGMGLLIAYFVNSGIYFMIGGVASLSVSIIMLYPARFFARIKKRVSSCISEIERSNKAVKLSRDQEGRIGLIKVGYSGIKILLPCEYLEIQRMDKNNFILVLPEGKSLYNRKRKEIVGQGPYETIKKTKYKIECIGKNGIHLFSLDGYPRFD